MAANLENLSRPSLESFRLCVQSVCPMFNVSSLKEGQFQALYSFICGEEVFVNLPTGSGKSLIFQMAPLVHMWMHENVSAIHWKKNPVIIIISPLLALMQDQAKKLSSLGFKAAFVGPEQDPKILEDIERGNFTFVYLSPESALTTERWRNTLESEIYQESLIGVAVDEVHCVTEWGTSSNNKNRSAFRVWYSRLNEIKSLVDVPFIALTATATQKTKDKIFDLLELRNPKQIAESPNKRNVRYTVQKLDKSLPIVENFRCLVNELKLKGKGTTRSIIYCQTVKQCAHLFRMFELELGLSMYDGEVDPRNRLVQMMHSGSPESVKSHVLEQFADSSKCLRILIATIAYGMGVNCKGVQRVIHFGPSKSIDAYLQESGRCGRDGKQSDAILLYNGINAKAADAEMKKYLESFYVSHVVAGANERRLYSQASISAVSGESNKFVSYIHEMENRHKNPITIYGVTHHLESLDVTLHQNRHKNPITIYGVTHHLESSDVTLHHQTTLDININHLTLLDTDHYQQTS